MFRFLIGCLLLITVPAVAEEKPNVVFILADDLGWADTTLYGETSYYETPNLERLAARGMTFERAYTSSPLCSPTRSAILTGLHPARTGLTAPNCHKPPVILQASVAQKAPPHRRRLEAQSVTRLDPRHKTLAEELKEAGYVTGHFGKWHLGKAPYSPLEHGFDVDIPNWSGPGPAGSFVAPWKFPNFPEAYPKEHIEDRMGDEAVAFLEAHRDEPFFLNYWQFSVHAPFDAKEEYIERHRTRIDPEDEQRSPTYAAMVQSLDENVGKLLDALDRLELSEKTIIVFYSDNGGNMYNEVDGTTPTSNRPLRGGKATNWEGGVRVPAVVVWPEVAEPGSRSAELITSTDFFPTFLEMLGKELMVALDGVSLLPALKGEALERDAVFTWFPHSPGVPDTLPPSAVMVGDEWKLIRLYHEGPQGEHLHRLYNLGVDIGESFDVAADHPERTTEMVDGLDSFLANANAVEPVLNPAWDPHEAQLREQGWQEQKNCTLQLEGGVLRIDSTGADPHFRVQLSDPLPADEYEIRVRIQRNNTGPVQIRWQEKGVSPAYDQKRLTTVEANATGWQTLRLNLKANADVTSIRVDPGSNAGHFLLDEFTIIQAGNAVRQWDFGGEATVDVPRRIAPVPLSLGPRRNFEIRQEKNGAWTLETTGEGAHFWTSMIPELAVPEDLPVLSFEYFSTEDIPNLRIRVPRQDGSGLQHSHGLVPFSEAWTECRIDFREAPFLYAAGEGRHFALIPGTKPGQQFQMRNLRLVPPNAQENLRAEERAAILKKREGEGEQWMRYLRTDYPGAFDGVVLGKENMSITASLDSVPSDRIGLLELEPHHPSYASLGTLTLIQEQDAEAGEVTFEIPRREGARDRAMSRWMIVALDSDGNRTALTPASWSTSVSSPRSLEAPQATGVKGLGGIPAGPPPEQILELGIHHATVNIVLNALLSSDKRPGWDLYEFEGQSYYLNRPFLNRLDQGIGGFTREGIVMSAILLVGNNRDEQGNPRSLMTHPEALERGKFAMPDLKTEEGARDYRAVIHFLTERYTREDEQFGRISNWIMHNEIDQSGTWTNMGDQPLPRYLETYLRSSRIVYHSARRFDPHARIFVSLTHHWTRQSGGPQTFIVRDIINLFAEAASKESDFEWGIAYHPYPESLRQPDTWNDEVSFDLETPYVTPKNLEVLIHYMDRPELHYQGEPRGLMLSEQGINALSLSEEDQNLQAAGIVYFMYRVQQFPQIEAFHYHGWRDAPEAEGGLLLGLINKEYGPKKAWEVYKWIETDRQAEASKFAWPIIGLEEQDLKAREVTE